MNEEELKRLIEKYYNGNSTEEEEGILKVISGEEISLKDMKQRNLYLAIILNRQKIPEPSMDLKPGLWPDRMLRNETAVPKG